MDLRSPFLKDLDYIFTRIIPNFQRVTFLTYLMKHSSSRSRQFFLLLFLPISLTVGCSSPSLTYSEYEDTTVAVYGPYRVIKLPINKGV